MLVEVSEPPLWGMDSRNGKEGEKRDSWAMKDRQTCCLMDGSVFWWKRVLDWGS